MVPSRDDLEPETELPALPSYDRRPVMFGDRPALFVVLVLLTPVVIGLLGLLLGGSAHLRTASLWRLAR